MSPIEIAVIAALCGMFGLAMLAALFFLIWQAWDLRRALATAQAENVAVYKEARANLLAQQTEMKAVFDSARNGFASIRNETKSLLENHQNVMQTQIAKINAEALAGTIARMIDVCLRLEKGIAVFQKMIFDNETRVSTDYGPEEFAAESTTFGGPPSGFSLGQNAKHDLEADQEAGGITLQESQ